MHRVRRTSFLVEGFTHIIVSSYKLSLALLLSLALVLGIGTKMWASFEQN